MRVLAKVLAAQSFAWDARRTLTWRAVLPQMTNWLPDEEAVQLRFEFEAEIRWLEAGQGRNPISSTGFGRVGVWRDGVRLSMSVTAPFVWRCLSGSAVAPFPHPPHRTGRADFPHPALGQDLTPSSTARRAQAGSGVRARSARRGARVDSSRPLVA